MAEQKNERTVRIPERFIKNKMIKIVGANAFAVFAVIQAHAKWSGEHSGESWPSYETIAELTGLHRTTISGAVKKLEAYGYIHVELKRKTRTDGSEYGQSRNHYMVSHMRNLEIKG